MKLVNAYTVHPEDIKSGDEMLFVVKALVTRPGVYRLYRCPWEGTEEDVPQGARVGLYEDLVCEALFPSLAAVADPDQF